MTNHDVEGCPQGSSGGRAAHIECHKYVEQGHIARCCTA